MSTREEAIANRYKNELKENDRFPFSCKRCGGCCANRNEGPIVLTGADIYRAARALGIGMYEFVEKYGDVSIGPVSHAPVVTLKTDACGRCVFLSGNKCSIQKDKPVVCAIFPLGRWYDSKEGRYHYFSQGKVCMGSVSKKTWTISEWAGEYNLDEADRYMREWTRLVDVICQYAKDIAEEDIPNEVYNMMFFLLYCDYEKYPAPYEVQISARIRAFNEMLAELKNDGVAV